MQSQTMSAMLPSLRLVDVCIKEAGGSELRSTTRVTYSLDDPERDSHQGATKRVCQRVEYLNRKASSLSCYKIGFLT